MRDIVHVPGERHVHYCFGVSLTLAKINGGSVMGTSRLLSYGENKRIKATGNKCVFSPLLLAISMSPSTLGSLWEPRWGKMLFQLLGISVGADSILPQSWKPH